MTFIAQLSVSDKRLNEIKEAMAKASPGPWEWSCDHIEEPSNDPELLEMGIDTEPAGFKNIQMKAAGEHRFWVELTEAAPNCIFDFDFISGARTWVPELVAEIERLRRLLELQSK